MRIWWVCERGSAKSSYPISHVFEAIYTFPVLCAYTPYSRVSSQGIYIPIIRTYTPGEPHSKIDLFMTCTSNHRFESFTQSRIYTSLDPQHSSIGREFPIFPFKTHKNLYSNGFQVCIITNVGRHDILEFIDCRYIGRCVSSLTLGMPNAGSKPALTKPIYIL